MLYLLKEHAKQISNLSKISPSQVGSLRTGKNTKDIWNTIFNFKRFASSSLKFKKNCNYSKVFLPGNNIFIDFFYRTQVEVTAYDETVQQDDSSEKENGEGSDFDISEAVQKLGLEENDSNVNHSFSGNGALLSLILLRHLKTKDLRKSVSYQNQQLFLYQYLRYCFNKTIIRFC